MPVFPSSLVKHKQSSLSSCPAVEKSCVLIKQDNCDPVANCFLGAGLPCFFVAFKIFVETSNYISKGVNFLQYVPIFKSVFSSALWYLLIPRFIPLGFLEL